MYILDFINLRIYTLALADSEKVKPQRLLEFSDPQGSEGLNFKELES